MPNSREVPQLNKFSTLTECQLYTVIMEICHKTCELDLIPTEFLGKILVHCIPAINKVVNLSLNMQDFFEEWKLAIV